MKKFKILILISLTISILTGCSKDFEEINKNPYALTSIDPALILTNAQRTSYTGFWEGEQTIVQQFVNAYNTGATAGFNFNEDNNNFNVPPWNTLYPGTLKLLEHIVNELKTSTTRTNLYNMARIWKAYEYMVLVDTYGDIPYSQSGKAYLEAIFYPKYDKDEAIYDALYNEFKTATAALDPSKDLVREDLFFGTSSSAAIQVAQWKKLGYSLLLRLGMRYSKVDATKARNIVQEAFNGGVMQVNADNVFLKFDAVYNNTLNAGPRGTNPYFYYLAHPFVTQLKTTKDPRLKYISGKYSNPNQVLALVPDTITDNQFGFPVGYDQTSVLNAPGYRGTAGTGQNYSQLNFTVFGSALAPAFFVTNAQTKFLLAEAAFRGWLTGLSGALSAQQYYEAGIRASMDEYSLYPNVSNPAIPTALQSSYLTDPSVAYSPVDALRQINTQYWIASVGNGAEAFANFRRSGFPALTPNAYNNNLSGGFARRFAYPNEESSRNSANYMEAVTSIGGNDNLTTRVFWDTN